MQDMISGLRREFFSPMRVKPQLLYAALDVRDSQPLYKVCSKISAERITIVDLYYALRLK
jgi:hypothetical protein